MALSLSLPVVQNWSCHSCGKCCRQHEIFVTEAERQRIVDQGWTEADGVPAGMRAFERVGGWFSPRYRLAHREDGACVFLDENNRCKIHARFGEAAKPLPCRIYPFAFHPAGKNIAVSLRFSCPSVVANSGNPVTQQQQDLQTMRDLVVPEGQNDWPAPLISPGQQLDWPDTLRITRALRDMVGRDPEMALAMRLVHALFVAGMLGRAKFNTVRGAKLNDLLDTLVMAAPHETISALDELPEPSKLAFAQFRLIVAQYCTRDTTASSGLAYRLRKVQAGMQLARGQGNTPAPHPALKSVPFAAVEQAMSLRQAEIDAMLQRYFEVKIAGMGFCGAGCYDLPVAEGFQRLVLVYPVVMYVTRWVAASAGRSTAQLSDAQTALTIVDHHHGYSPLMRGRSFRNRARWLFDHNELCNLIAWYSR